MSVSGEKEFATIVNVVKKASIDSESYCFNLLDIMSEREKSPDELLEELEADADYSFKDSGIRKAMKPLYVSTFSNIAETFIHLMSE